MGFEQSFVVAGEAGPLKIPPKMSGILRDDEHPF